MNTTSPAFRFSVAAVAFTGLAALGMYLFWYMSPFEQCVRSARALAATQRAADKNLSEQMRGLTIAQLEAIVIRAKAAKDEPAAKVLSEYLADERARLAIVEQRAVSNCMSAAR